MITRSLCVGSLTLIAVAAGFALAEDCPDIGDITVGCGEGEHYCYYQSQPECGLDSMKILAVGPFECGTVEGRHKCVTSKTNQSVCYWLYDCEWDYELEACFIAYTAAEPHKSWIKESLPCPVNGG